MGKDTSYSLYYVSGGIDIKASD